MKKIVFLDRNIISYIRQYNEGKCLHAAIMEKLDELKHNDVRGNFISPMLSIIEGDKRKLESEDEILDTLENEFAELEKFFKNAHIDPSTKKLARSLSRDFTSLEYQEIISNRIQFLNEINLLICHTRNDEQKRKCIDEIICIASKYGLEKQHIIVISALLCLFSQDSEMGRVCRRIIKPKQEIEDNHFYNAIMDFEHFCNFCIFFNHYCDSSDNVQPYFYTADKNLQQFFEYFRNIIESKIVPNGYYIKFNLQGIIEKFPKLLQEKLENLEFPKK